MITGQINELGEREEEVEQDWLFTFGFSQLYPNKFIRIRGTEASTRTEMLKRFGRSWSFQYPAHKEQELKRFFITELKEE